MSSNFMACCRTYPKLFRCHWELRSIFSNKFSEEAATSSSGPWGKPVKMSYGLLPYGSRSLFGPVPTSLVVTSSSLLLYHKFRYSQVTAITKYVLMRLRLFFSDRGLSKRDAPSQNGSRPPESCAGFRQKNSSAEIQCSLLPWNFQSGITHGKLDADTPLMSKCTISHVLESLLFIITGQYLCPHLVPTVSYYYLAIVEIIGAIGLGVAPKTSIFGWHVTLKVTLMAAIAEEKSQSHYIGNGCSERSARSPLSVIPKYRIISTVSSRILKICWPRWPIIFLLNSSDLKRGLFCGCYGLLNFTVTSDTYGSRPW